MTDPLAVHDDPFVTRRDKPRLVIFSGAGLSAESGIATFRDSDGLWENHDVEEVCNIDTFEKNYRLVHKFYNQRRIQLVPFIRTLLTKRTHTGKRSTAKIAYLSSLRT